MKPGLFRVSVFGMATQTKEQAKKEFRAGDRVFYTREGNFRDEDRVPMQVETRVIRATKNRIWIEMQTPHGPLRKYVQAHHLIKLED